MLYCLPLYFFPYFTFIIYKVYAALQNITRLIAKLGTSN
jgi:hypothetical protein